MLSPGQKFKGPSELSRILKTGVPEPSLPKTGSSTIQKNIASFKKYVSQHQILGFRTANCKLVRALGHVWSLAFSWGHFKA